MATPHDALFSRLFSDPKHAVGELSALLPADVERLVAWDTLRRPPATYKDPDHGDQHADLLFGVDIGGRPALLYLLLEHKSTGDPRTAFQLLRYVVRVLEQFWRERPTVRRLPPIVAMVVHHGRRGWRRGTELIDLFDLDETTRPALAPWLPALRFLLDELSLPTPEVLAGRTLSALTALTLQCLQRIRDGADILRELRELRGAFLAAVQAPDTGDALAAVLGYVARVRDIPPDELRGIIRITLGPERERAMTSTYDQLLNRGRRQGRVEGRREGKAEGKAELLLKLLAQRFGPLPVEIVDRVYEADAPRIESWTLRVLDAAHLGQVFTGD